jgi:hypothetical protein
MKEQSPLTTSAMRLILLIASVLVLSVTISLYLLTEQTDRYFAWTIGLPLTAAFLGSGYGASFLLEYLSAQERVWARARLAVPSVLLFTTLTLIATLLHLESFHFDSPHFITRAGTWVWMVIYCGVPPALALVWFHQIRQPGSEPSIIAPIPGWMRLLLTSQAAVMLLLGAALFIGPTAVSSIWPWALTALTGRVVGAWLVGIGAIAAHAAWENDWVRVENMMISYLTFAILQFIALLRYPEAVTWGSPSAWLYVPFQLTVLGAGLSGWLVARRARQNLTRGNGPRGNE